MQNKFFKNRYSISNLINHKKNFNVDAEWHFSATAHGKGAHDGLGAKFKRAAYLASLVAIPQNAMLKPLILFEWAKKNFKEINILYFDKVSHEKIRRKLNQRFNNAEAVPEILKNHGFVLKSEKELLIKRYSNDKIANIWNI